MAKETKTSLENSTRSTRSTSTGTANHPITKSVRMAFKSRKRIKKIIFVVHVLHKTLNLVSTRCCFAEDGKEMFQNSKSTFREIVIAH